MARTAEVKRDARIGEAEARADSQIKEAIAEEERLAARLVNDIEIAKAQRDFELKKAAYDQEVQAKVSDRISFYTILSTFQRGIRNWMFVFLLANVFVISFEQQKYPCLSFNQCLLRLCPNVNRVAFFPVAWESRTFPPYDYHYFFPSNDSGSGRTKK